MSLLAGFLKSRENPDASVTDMVFAQMRGLPRWAAVAGCLLIPLSFQIEMTHDKLSRPFLDGSLHYDYDNANFLFKARNGILLGEAATQFGITDVAYSSWGAPEGKPEYYTHHPFLVRALFQLFVRVCGDAEWVSRTFSLGVSAIAAFGVFFALLIASGSLLASLSATLVLVNIPVFATYQTCIKYELDGMVLGVWFFVAVGLYLRGPSSKARLATVAGLAALSALAHWTALLFVASVLAWLLFERIREHDPVCGAAASATAIGAFVGAMAVLATFVLLKGGWVQLFSDLFGAAATRSDTAMLAAGAWTERQLMYANMNFGGVLIGVCTVLSVASVVLWLLRRRPDGSNPRKGAVGRLLPAFFFCTLAAACAWQFAFRQGSYIHVFWQLWFCLPFATLIAVAVTATRERPLVHAVIGLCGILLVFHLNVASRAAYKELFQLERGTPEDVAFLKSLRSDVFTRFLFIPLEDVAFNGWFAGPTFEYYTDRGIRMFDGTTRLMHGDKVLVLAHENQSLLMADLGKHLGVVFINEKCGSRFCSYDIGCR